MDAAPTPCPSAPSAVAAAPTPCPSAVVVAMAGGALVPGAAGLPPLVPVLEMLKTGVPLLPPSPALNLAPVAAAAMSLHLSGVVASESWASLVVEDDDSDEQELAPMMPPDTSLGFVDLADLLSLVGPYSTFLDYLTKTDVTKIFQSQAAFFAPVDSAFAAIDSGALSSLTTDQLMLHHTTPRYYLLSAFSALAAQRRVRLGYCEAR
ncbi:hypothetical protein ACQ4PT_022354 [Festuca glaucescens]